jgi:hypothetical protein
MEPFFWSGMFLIFVPSAVRLLSPEGTRCERIGLVCMVGMALYVVSVIKIPLSFSPYDAFLHWRTANDLAETGHLFTENTLLPASPFYPGLEIVTNALSTSGELTTYYAGTLVIGVARLIMVLALFLIFEHATKCSRLAGIATVLYMVNPHFLFFSADFVYESLALPMATFVLFLLVRLTSSGECQWKFVSLACIAWTAVAITHHVTSYFFETYLILWVLICILHNPPVVYRFKLLFITVVAGCICLAWINLPGNPVVTYLTAYFRSALIEVTQIVAGTSSTRRLFSDYSGGHPIPVWQRSLAISYVVIILSALPFGLVSVFTRYRQNALIVMFGVASLLYPFSLFFRLTSFGPEVTDRAAAFLFIPLALILAISTTQLQATKATCACAMAVMFLGGIVAPSWQLFPGPYLVAADPRSVEPQGIQTALWAYSFLGPKNRIAADRINGVLMDTYGGQRVQSSLAGDLDLISVFFAPELGCEEKSLLRRSKVRFLVIDKRLTTTLPAIGFYYEPGEPGSYRRVSPLGPEAFRKFDIGPEISRIFDAGSIVVFDVGGLAKESGSVQLDGNVVECP